MNTYMFLIVPSKALEHLYICLTSRPVFSRRGKSKTDRQGLQGWGRLGVRGRSQLSTFMKAYTEYAF